MCLSFTIHLEVHDTTITTAQLQKQKQRRIKKITCHSKAHTYVLGAVHTIHLKKKFSDGKYASLYFYVYEYYGRLNVHFIAHIFFVFIFIIVLYFCCCCCYYFLFVIKVKFSNVAVMVQFYFLINCHRIINLSMTLCQQTFSHLSRIVVLEIALLPNRIYCALCFSFRIAFNQCVFDMRTYLPVSIYPDDITTQCDDDDDNDVIKKLCSVQKRNRKSKALI